MFQVKIYRKGVVSGTIEFPYADAKPKKYVVGADEDMVFDEADLMELEPDQIKSKVQKVMVDKTATRTKSKVALYPEDTVEDLKYKILMVTDVFPFQQHLWADFKGNIAPISYRVRLNGKLEPLDILGCDKSKKLEGIPIDEDMYKRAPSISIDAMDKFTNMNDIVGRYGHTIYMVTLDNYLESPNLREIVKDRQQLSMIFRTFIILYFPMLNMEAFSEYVQTRHIGTKYPWVQPSKAKIEEKYEARSKIRDHTGYQKLSMAVSSSVIGAYSSANIDIRNLFNEFVLGPKEPYCQAVMWKDRNKLLLQRVWNKVQIKHSIINQNLEAGSITIVIRSRDFTRSSSEEKGVTGIPFMQFILKIREDGKYTVKTNWGSNMEMSIQQTYDTTAKFVNPVLRRINALGGKVFGSDRRRLELMSLGNTYFSSLNMSFYWGLKVSTTGFATLMAGLDKLDTILSKRKTTSYDYVFSVGSIKITENIRENLFEYGNGFAYLFDMTYRDRLGTLDKHGQITVIHRATDIKFEITDLQEHSIPTVGMYLSKICDTLKRGVESARASKGSAKLLRTLKEKDPALYDYGKVFNKRRLQVYSIKCQKKHQPMYLESPSVGEIKQAREDKKKGVERKQGVVEYYNFTSDEPAYYRCPNSEFPFLRFVTGVHPKGFCLPCCQKSTAPISYRKDDKSLKARTQKSCMDVHTYDGDEIELKSRYVMVYGKSVDVGRIAHLPDSSLGPLMKTNSDSKFYIYGVPQDYKNLRNIGMLNVISMLRNRPVDEIIDDMIIAIQQNTDKFHLLLGGRIETHFENPISLINEIRNVFLVDHSVLSVENKLWNDIIMSIHAIFLGLTTIAFVDKGNVDDISLFIPPKVVYHDEFFRPGLQCLIIQKTISPIVRHYYPIVLVNQKEFFKNKTIRQTTFEEEELGFLKRLLQNQLIPKKVNQNDLYFITMFVKAHKEYEIESQYLGPNNFTYAVQLSRGNKKLYIPVAHSQSRRDIPMIKEFPARFDTTMAELQSFFKKANSYIKRLSQDYGSEQIYPLYQISLWLEYKNSILGAGVNGLNFYFKPISSAVANKMEGSKEKLPTMVLLYHPTTTNRTHGNKLIDSINKKVPESFYSVYSHKLVLLQFATYFRKQKNTRIRKKIVDELKKIVIDNFSSKITFMNKMRTFQLSDQDIRVLSRQLQVITKKSDLVNVFENGAYDFDMLEFENLRTMNVKEVNKKLTQISKTIFKTGTVKISEFPDLITGCNVDQDYCSNGKMVIDPRKLGESIDILATDILNPLKTHSVFYIPDIILNYYSFKIRPYEEITIDLI